MVTTTSATTTIDWLNEIVPRVKTILEERRQQGIPTATIRGIFYILVSENLIENLPQPYKGLSDALVKARRNGFIPYDWITDENREIINIRYDTYRAPSRIIKDMLDNLASVPNEYTDKYMPRWYKQPEYVEVWVEKNAMAGVMSAVLTESRQVRVVPNGGWASETYHHDNFIRLQAKKVVLDYELIKKYPDSPLQWSTGETRKVTVLYYGDYDPTGSRMVKNLERDLKEIGVNFERVAITKEQIIEYNLEHLKEGMTDDVKAKLKRDANARAFMSENNDMLFQIELDALNALRPRDFISLLEDSVDKHFDESIYQEVLNDRIHSEKAIKRELRKQIKGFKI